MTRFLLQCVRNTVVFLVFWLLAGRALAAADTGTFDLSLIDLAFRGIAEGNWFLVAGPALTLVTYAVRWLLADRWPALVESDRWGVAITAALAGAGALAHAWLAGESGLEATTWLGAIKVFITAVATYVVTRKLAAPSSTSKSAAKGGLVSLVLLTVMLAGCPSGGGTGPGPVIADSIVDCVHDNRPQIDALLIELSPLLAFQSPDWSAVYARAKTAGRDVGGCAIAELVQRYLGGRTAVPSSESWRARDTLERFRATEAGGATFRTAYGDL